MRYSFIIFIVLALSAGCGSSVSSVSRTLLGTVVTVTLDADSGEKAELFSAAFSEIEKIQKEFSLYDPDSEVSIVNRDAVFKPVRVSDDVFYIFMKSHEVSYNTAGAFDITWASAGRLWDFSDPEKFTPPDEARVKSVLPLISYKNLELDPAAGTVRILKNGTKIGLGGIVKGFATARAAAVLRSRNVRGAIVACAGDIQVIGTNNGRPWRAGIQDPRGAGVIGSLEMHDGDAVSTSGDYERFRIVNGRRYHHIIDPSTGYPADSGLISVSVFSKDPVICDAYSTAFFILGLEDTKRVMTLTAMKGVSVVLVSKDMKVYVSESLRGRIKFRDGLEVIYF